MAVARKIAYNVVFNAISKILSTAIALVSIGFITRYLGKDGFGDYSIILAFFAFFNSIADLGLYSIGTREIAKSEDEEDKILGNIFTLRMVTSLVVLLLSPLIAYFLPYSLEVKFGIILAATSFTFGSLYQVLNCLFQKRLAMDRVGLSEFLGKIVQISLIILAIKNDWGFNAIIFALVGSMFFNFCLVYLFSKKYSKFKLQFDFTYWKKFLKMSLPMGVSVIITFIYFKMDTILLSVMKDNSEVGIYNVAYKVIENLTFFPAMIMGLVLPIISQSISTDRKRFEYMANETAKVFFLILIPLIVGALFLSEDIIRIIGGAGFSQSAIVLRILIFALAFIFFGNFFNSILIAANQQKKLMYILFFCALFNITANLIFIPKYSYTASAIISVITEMFVVLSAMILSYRHIEYTPKVKYLSRIILSGVAMSASFVLLSRQHFLISATLSSLIYIFTLWLTQTITFKELRSIFTTNDRLGIDEV